jgi:hypothetical protein
MPSGSTTRREYLVEWRNGSRKLMYWIDLTAVAAMVGKFDVPTTAGAVTFEPVPTDDVPLPLRPAEMVVPGQHTAPPRPTLIPTTTTTPTVDSDELFARSQGIWKHIHKAVHADMASRGVGSGLGAMFQLHPDTGLQKLYTAILGSTERAGHQQAMIASHASVQDLVVSLVAAFLYTRVCGEEPDWLPSFDKYVAVMTGDGVVREWDGIVRHLGE